MRKHGFTVAALELFHYPFTFNQYLFWVKFDRENAR
jgi:hypothetical protein